MRSSSWFRITVLLSGLSALAGCGDQTPAHRSTPTVWAVGSGPFNSNGSAPLGGVATHSDDGGDTWKAQFFPSGLAGVHFVDRSRGWLVGVDGVFSTDDEGISWQSRRDRFPPAAKGFPAFTGVTFLDEQRGVIVGEGLDDQGGLEPVFWYSFAFLTRDGGKSWVRIPFDGRGIDGAYLTSVCFTADGFGVASGDAITIVSRDGGESWTRIAGPSGRAGCSGRRDLWLIGSGAGPLYHSNDGGVSWIDVSATLPSYAGPAHAGTIGFLDEDFGWIAGIAGALFVTSNAGASWETKPLLSNQVIFDLATFLTPERGIAVTWGAGAVTDDGGDSWRIVGLGAGTQSFRFADLAIAH